MTRGPLAMLFGGNEILPELSDRKAGRHIQILGLVSSVWILSILCRLWKKKNKTNNFRDIVEAY